METTPTGTSKEVDKGATLSLWAVAYLDLLGYRTVLSQMDLFPIPTRPQDLKVLSDAFVRAVHFRQRLIGQTNQFMESALRDPPELESFPRDVQDRVLRVRRARMIQSPGPDHVILACPLAADPAHFPIRAVYNLVVGSAITMLVQLAMGSEDLEDTLPLRGGIDIAPGGLYGDPEFLFSPAVASAYELESQDAVYARIIAGDRVRAFLEESMLTKGDNVEAKVERSTSERIRRMFFHDFDGWLTLDFLGEAMAQTLDHEPAKPMIAKAWRFVTLKLKYSQGQRQHRIAAKYAWLVHYMRPRLALWEVPS
jgi:hypothetical protein